MKKERKAGLVLNYDNVLDYLGQFGCFQRRVFLCMCLVSFLTGPPTVIFAFAGESHLHRHCLYFDISRLRIELQMSSYLVWRIPPVKILC